MTDFRDFYSIDALADYVRARRAEDAARERIRLEAGTAGGGREGRSPQASNPATAVWIGQLEVFQSSVLAFLKARAADGELKPIPFCEGRRLAFADAWNRLVAQSTPGPHDEHRLVSGCGLRALWVANDADPDDPGPSMERAYESLVARLNDGSHIEPGSAYGDCAVTGNVYYLEMGSGWKPRYGTFDAKHDFVPLTSGPPAPAVAHVSIPVPSGQLLVADWFRIEGFTDAVDVGDQDGRKSLNTAAGCREATDRYAMHGLMSVSVGNTSPSVFVRNGQFLVASAEFDEESGDDRVLAGENLGSITTDLWWVSAIDREVLTSLIAQSVSEEVARARVASFIEEWGCTTVSLPPGSTLHVYHVDEEGLQGRFRCADVDDSGCDPLYLVASLNPLEWEEAPAPRAANALRP